MNKYKPIDPDRTSKTDGVAVKCCECGNLSVAVRMGLKLVPQYNWRMFRVGLKTYFICPSCQAKRAAWAK